MLTIFSDPTFLILKEVFGNDFVKQVIIFLVAWWMVRGTVTKHLEKIENGLATLASKVGELAESLTSYSKRLEHLEQDVRELKKNQDKNRN